MIPLELDLEVEIAEDVDLEVEAVTDTGNVRTQTKTATPSKAAQSVLPDEGFLLSGVDVDPIPDNFVDADDPETACFLRQILEDFLLLPSQYEGTYEPLELA